MQVQSLLCLKSSWKKKRTIGWITSQFQAVILCGSGSTKQKKKTKKKEREWMPSLPLRGVTFETKSPVMSCLGQAD